VNQTGPGNSSNNSLTVRRLCILGILLGVCLLIWLQIEDSSDRWVLLFSAAVSALATAQIWLRLSGRFGERGYWLPLAGLLAGLLITPAALLLMVIKTGLHGHQGPDFSGDQILGVIVRTPVWIVSGLIIGVGLDIFQRGKSPNPAGNKQL
jgi:hypothetical protein